MVFENILAEVLNRVLGDYVENLNSKQLSVGIWGGDVVLENLVLKHSVADELNLPLKASYGQLGKLVLKIPWQNLYSAPVVANVERLYLVLVPSVEIAYDPTKEEKWAQEAKQAILEKVELARKRALEKNLPKADDSFVEKLATQILKNVQIKIQDIHIRFEDKVTNVGRPFAFGITLHNLSILSTSKNWEETVTQDAVDQFHKVLNLEGLAIYWNCDLENDVTKQNTTALIACLKDGIYSKDYIPRGYRYMLGPINSTMKLIMTPRPELSNNSNPKFQIMWDLENLSIGISKSQYQDLICLMDSFDRLSRAIPYRKYRPQLTSYVGHYKEWWKFAFTCILEEDVRRVHSNWKWSRIQKHCQRCRNYASAYRSKLTVKKMSEELITELSDLEKHLDVFNIILLRNRVKQEVDAAGRKLSEAKKEGGWFSSWWGESSKKVEDTLSAAAIARQLENAMTSEEKMKLYGAIDYEENSNTTEFPDDYIELSFKFELGLLDIEIRDEDYENPRVLYMELKGVRSKFETRPAANGIKALASISQFTIYGLQQGKYIPKLVISKELIGGTTLIDLLCELHPIDKKCDQRIHITSRPLEIIYDAQTVIKLLDVFTPPEKSYAIDQLQAAANVKLKDFKEMSALGLQYAIQNHTILDLNVDLQSSYVIIPYKGVYHRKEDIVLINLGRISMQSVRKDTTNVRTLHNLGTSDEDILQEMMSQSYDNFVIQLQDMQVLIALKGENWKPMLQESCITQLHLLTPTSLLIHLDKCVISDDPRLPKVKILAELPNVSFSFSDERLLHLLAVFSSMPMAEESDLDVRASETRSHSSSMSAISQLVMPLEPGKQKDSKPWLKLNEEDAKQTGGALNQAVNIDMKFEMQDFSLSIHKKNKYSEETMAYQMADKLLMFHLMQLEMKMTQSSSDMNVTIRIGGVSCDVNDAQGTIRMLDTPMAAGEQKDLFLVHYITADKESLAYRTTHGYVQQYLEVNFTSLSIRLHQEALLNLMALSTKFQSDLNAIMSEKKVEGSKVSQMSHLSHIPLMTIPESTTEMFTSKKLNKKRTKKSNAAAGLEIIFKFKASLENLNVFIVKRRKALATIAIKGCFVEMNFKPLTTQILARLKDVMVLDLDHRTDHTKIVSVVGHEVLDAELIMHNHDESSKSNIAPDMTIKANISCIRVVYLNSFVQAIMNFANTFQAAQERLMNAAADAAEVAKQNIIEAKSTCILLQIDFQAPLFIIPINLKNMNAIVCDFGKLIISNKLQIVAIDHTSNQAVVDNIVIELQALKLSRVKLNKTYDQVVECPLLEPVSFDLEISRNLSTSWYEAIPDIRVNGQVSSLHISLTEEDFKMVMRVISENFSEEYVTESHEEKSAFGDWRSSNRLLTVKEEASTIEKKFEITLSDNPMLDEMLDLDKPLPKPASFRLTFTMDYLYLDLFNGGIKVLDGASAKSGASTGLARFSMHNLYTECTINADQSLSMSLLLSNCLMEDMRSNRSDKLTRLMQRKDVPDIKTSTSKEMLDSDNPVDIDVYKNMIQLSYQQNGIDLVVDLQVYSFDLILSLEYLLKLSDFFTAGFSTPERGAEEIAVFTEATASKTNIKAKHSSRRSSTITRNLSNIYDSVPKKAPVKESMLTINVKLQKPDIILVESMDDINTSSIILNSELNLKVRLSGNRQVINGSILDLQLFSCCYNPEKRAETKALILHPCSIFVAGSTPDEQGLHLDISISDVRLAVSPDTIELLNKVYQALYGSVTCEEKTTEEADYSEIWNIKQFTESDYWFLKTEIGEDAMESSLASYASLHALPKEICVVNARSIVITIEAGVGKQTLPMVKVETTLDAVARNWSSDLEVESTLSIKMSYYNSRLALWEPLIEPLESYKNGKRELHPWELKANLVMNRQLAVSSTSADLLDDCEEITEVPPAVKYSLLSDENMEMTVTKTSMDVLTDLGTAFQNAVTLGWRPQSDAIQAPYIVQNDTGLPIKISLQHSLFQLHGVNTQDYDEVLLAPGCVIGLSVRDDYEEMPQSASKSALHSSRASSLSSLENRNVISEKYITVVLMEGDSTITLPVVRADKRYFNLQYRGDDNEPWGLVSHVKVMNGSTLITLRGILQVHNHFNVSINVYYMTNRGNELECIGTIKPDSELNLPLDSIYTLTNELFFSVDKFTVSIKPFIWKNLKNLLSTTELLECQPKNPEDGASFFMKVVGDIEQVFYENSHKHTMNSTLYNIHLRPAIIIRNLLPVNMTATLEGGAKSSLINAGERVHFPTAEPGVTKLAFAIHDYLEKDWLCSQGIQWNSPAFAVCSFFALTGASRIQLDLGIHTECFLGTATMSIYCPFWMLNKTGISLSYRSDETSNVLHHPGDHKGPILFSFKAKSFFGKKKASVKMEDGEWSDKFSLDVAGSSGIVHCKTNGINYQLGVHIQLTNSTLTKQVTFTPFFVLINNSSLTIEVQEADRPADPWTKVETESCTPLWPISNDKEKELRLRIANTKELSAPFSYSTTHTTLLKVENKHGGVNVDIQITDAAVYITFSCYTFGLAPALLMNHTRQQIEYWEKGNDVKCVLNANESALFTWQIPVGNRKVVWKTGNQEEVQDDLRKDGLGDFNLPNDEETILYWVSFLDGIQRILLFTDDLVIAERAQTAGEFEPIQTVYELSIHGLGLSLVNNITNTEILYIGIASSGIAWETQKGNKKRFKPLNVNDSESIEVTFQRYQSAKLIHDHAKKPLPSRFVVNPEIEVDFVTNEMLKPTRRSMRRTYYVGLWVQIKMSRHQYHLHAKINRIQIDNQMHGSIFPVVLAPVLPPRTVVLRQVAKPFAELSIVRRIMEYSTVQQYKYFKFLIQEFHIKIDIGLINALVEIFEAKEMSEVEELAVFRQDANLVNEPLLAHVSLLSSQEQKNFYDFLHMSPLKFHLSFSLASGGTGAQKSKQETPHFLSVLLQSLGVTLTDVQDVVFKLAYFERDHIFLTQTQLVDTAYYHYFGQAVKQLYVLVLGLDVLGNPYGLVLGLTQGVEDLFYEPFQGAIQGPGEFAEGLVLGVRSLFGHTVGGAAGAASRITGVMGKGIAALTFDKDYQRKRQEALNQRPANVQMGLAQSGKGLVMGVVDGVSGVFTKPISGAREDGVAGFFTGMGKGVMGLVTRPTAGVIDFASGSLDAVKRVTEINDEVLSLRLPRYFHQDNLIRPYSSIDAQGNKILNDIDKGRFISTDNYVYHLNLLDSGKDILLLTDKRVMFITHNEMFGKSLSWSYTWEALTVPPRVKDNGIYLTPPNEGKRGGGFGVLFGTSANDKFVPLKNAGQKELIVQKITDLMKS